MKVFKKIRENINRVINTAQPEICYDVATWAQHLGWPVQQLAEPIYHEVRSFFSNEEMAMAMVDTHKEVLSRPQSLVVIDKPYIRETLGLVELRDGRVLLEGNWWLPSLLEHPTYRKRIGLQSHILKGDIYSLLSMWSTNYYHWFHDVLPRLEAAFPYLPRETRYLINEKPAAWQLDALAAYGIDLNHLEIQPPTARTQIERLWFSTPAGQTGLGSVKLLKKVSERLRGYWHTPTKIHQCGVYISRAKSRCRKILNETELNHILDAYSFENVTCEDLSLAEQLHAFWNASNVLAPHGAGLTNTMFTRSGTVVGEVHYEETVFTNHYWFLAQQFHLSHSHLKARKVDLPNGEYDLEADLAVIENWLAGNPPIADS